MPEEKINGREPEKTEDNMQREHLGPRGVPVEPDPAKMTPQREKKTPKNITPATLPSQNPQMNAAAKIAAIPTLAAP